LLPLYGVRYGLAGARLVAQKMDILLAAAKAIQNRHDRHGDYRACHEVIANLWSAYLSRPITPTDVARMMILLKVARSQEGDETDPDHATDIAGYAALLQQLASFEPSLEPPP
jgi:hypothetical protein